MKYPPKERESNERPAQDYEAFRRIINNPVIYIELFNSLLGKFLGEGSSRIVFEYLPDPKYVIKIEKGDWHSNVIENEIWQNVITTKWEKWFAPIKYISPNGVILIQRKCNFLSEIPKKIPNFLSDVRLDNMGEFNGHPVVLDYAMNDLLTIGLKQAKLINYK